MGKGQKKCSQCHRMMGLYDTHPTCTNCREEVCDRDRPCNICSSWTEETWVKFNARRTHKSRSKTRRSATSRHHDVSPSDSASDFVSLDASTNIDSGEDQSASPSRWIVSSADKVDLRERVGSRTSPTHEVSGQQTF